MRHYENMGRLVVCWEFSLWLGGVQFHAWHGGIISWVVEIRLKKLILDGVLTQQASCSSKEPHQEPALPVCAHPTQPSQTITDFPVESSKP